MGALIDWWTVWGAFGRHRVTSGQFWNDVGQSWESLGDQMIWRCIWMVQGELGMTWGNSNQRRQFRNNSWWCTIDFRLIWANSEFKTDMEAFANVLNGYIYIYIYVYIYIYIYSNGCIYGKLFLLRRNSMFCRFFHSMPGLRRGLGTGCPCE